MGGYAWVTLATNDSYSLGALVLAHSLKKSKTAHKSVVLITPAVSQPMREQLHTVFDVIKVVDVLDSKDEAHLALMQRPELGITFTKIHCWRLIEFDKCVFLDADTLIVRNCDELFEREEFSAAPDVSWPDCFNSGVFVYKPSIQTFNELLQFAVEKGSFDGGDQGLLNQFFSGWATEDIKKHLPFIYNLTSIAAYSYIPAFKHYGSETRIVHFIGAGKPWLQQLDPATRTITPTSGSEHLAPLLQQWWDLFCEKVHPNLDKNLASSNDGMSHPPVAACSNSLPVALIDDSQMPRLVEYCTPYREKDDFRQYNLPYQPFDVKGSSGELLNEEFLLASTVHPTPPEVSLDEQKRQEGYEVEERDEQEERNENEETGDWNLKENEIRREMENVETALITNSDVKSGERTGEWKEVEAEEQKQEDENQEQSNEIEQPIPLENPFDHKVFFPDEICINKYMEQNVMTYQPYDNHRHLHHQLKQDQQHESHHHDNNEKNSQHSIDSSEIDLSDTDPRPSEDPAQCLPRFLSIPENDGRQSGNTEICFQTRHPEPKSDLTQADHSILSHYQSFSQKEAIIEKRELTKSKSMPYLRYEVTEMPPSGSIWKSQPNVNVDPNRKYLMPKLRPILPRQNSLRKSVSSIIMPKVTLYTEFFMSSEYKDPEDLPKDKVGFVDTFIHEKGQLRRSKSAADIADKFGPLPYNSSPEIERPVVLMKIPSLHLENELYDLSQCKRQMGNKPKAKGENQRKKTGRSLPALKPLIPPKDKKSTLIKKRKSKELSPEDGGREKIFKREPKTSKERKRECKTTSRNVSLNVANGNNVNDILTRLREFSKNYQHFFDVDSRPGNSTVKCRNTVVQADDLIGSEWDASKSFLKTLRPGRTAVSQTAQTTGEEKSVQQNYTLDSKFSNFRNYVKEKSETSQKGLLSIQDLVSKVRREDEVVEAVKTSSEMLSNCSELKEGREKNFIKVVGDQMDGAIERKDSEENGSLVERKTPGKDINISHPSSAKATEIRERHQSNCKLCITSVKENRVEDNSNKIVKSISLPTCGEPKEVERNDVVKNLDCSSLPEGKSDSKPEASAYSEKGTPESQCLPIVSGTGDAVLSSQERETQMNGLGRERENSASKGYYSLEVEINDDLALAKKERDVGQTEEISLPLKSDSGEDEARTARRANSYSDRIKPVGNGCPETFWETTQFVELQPTFQKLSTSGFADASYLKKTFSENKELKAETKINSRAEELKNSHKLEEKEQVSVASLHCGKKKQMEDNGSHDKLRNTKKAPLEASSSSCVPLPVSKDTALEVVAATVQRNHTSAPQSPTSLKTSTYIFSPKCLSGTPPKDSPDATAPLSPLSTPSNGVALPESQKDMKVSSGIAGAIAQLSLEAGSDQSSESVAGAFVSHQEYVRRQNWETGNMDYMGRDSFDNIWSKICQTLEGKEAEEAGAAAASPQQFTKIPNPSTTNSAEETKTSEQLPASETPAFLSTVPEKCPEYIELLSGEPAADPVEDDEVIFSKPGNEQSSLTDRTEVEEGKKESPALGTRPVEAGKTKLTNTLESERSSSDREESNQSDITGESKKPESIVAEEQVAAQKATEKTSAQEEAEASAGAKDEESQQKPGVAEVPPETRKTECQIAICQPLLPSQQLLSGGGTNTLETSVKDDKSRTEKETEKCTTVAIPSPPIIYPGSPSCEKDKKAQFRRKPENSAQEKFDPIPLPPPENPMIGEDAPVARTPDAVKDQGKQKKGVFTKILEMVGVTPKEKNADEISKSVFYNVEEDAAPPTESEAAKAENSTTTVSKKQAPTAAADSNEVPPKQIDDPGKSLDDEEKKETEGKVDPTTLSKDTGVSPFKLEEKNKDTYVKPPETDGTEKTDKQKPLEPTQSDPKLKLSIEKPARNVSPKELTEIAKKSMQVSPKSTSPSPKLTLSKEPPVMAITAPTPSPQLDFPVRECLLKVDQTILETPPIPPEPPMEGSEEFVKSKLSTEVENIIGKAKSEVESRLLSSQSSGKKEEENSDSINMMNMLMGSEQAEQGLSSELQMEELRVTSEEERMRHKGEVLTSKLSDQILKAIPPPRRKAISEGSTSTSVIPKPSPASEQRNVPEENKPKTSKPSSIPVPPPRHRGKPAQPMPSKGKGKK